MALPNSVKTEWIRLQELYPELRSWRLKENNRATQTLGSCRSTKNHLTGVVYNKEIWLASWLWRFNNEDHPQLLETLRHEAAHALAPFGEKHGCVWRSIAKQLGSDGTRAVDFEQKGKGLQNHITYKAACPVCGKVHLNNRRRLYRRCSCSNGLDIASQHATHLTFRLVRDESELLNV